MTFSLSLDISSQERWKSFDTLSKWLSKTQQMEGMSLKLPFPQVLCHSSCSQLARLTLTPDHALLQPLQDLTSRLKQQTRLLSKSKKTDTLRKIKKAYQTFIEDMCQTVGDKRKKLLEIDISSVHRLVQPLITSSKLRSNYFLN